MPWMENVLEVDRWCAVEAGDTMMHFFNAAAQKDGRTKSVASRGFPDDSKWTFEQPCELHDCVLQGLFLNIEHQVFNVHPVVCQVEG